MIKIYPLSILTGLLVAGCGGGDSGGTTPDIPLVKKDGIYINKDDLTVMLVDTELTTNSVIVGDYIDNAFYTNNSHSIDGDTLTLQGIRYVSEIQWEHSPTDSLNANFTDTGVSILGVIDQSNFAYSLERTSDSLLFQLSLVLIQIPTMVLLGQCTQMVHL